jgi:hypothetical protein
VRIPSSRDPGARPAPSPAAALDGDGPAGLDWLLGDANAEQGPLELQSVRPPQAGPAPGREPPFPAQAPRAPGQPWGRWEGASVRPLPVQTEPEPPLVLTLGLRTGLGLAGFVLIVAVRQCDPLGTGVHELLADWDAREGGAAALASVRYGPVATQWMESDLHQFMHPDKDRVRGLVTRYLAAGAVQVYVGDIRQDTVLKHAGALIVELPPRGPRRAGVFALHGDFFAVGADRIGTPDSLEDTGQEEIVIRL